LKNCLTGLIALGALALASCGDKSLIGTDTVAARLEAAHARNDGPPIWKVTDADSTLYLYGTVHFLPGDLDWQKQDMIDAFAEAGTVFFETSSDEAAGIKATVLTNSLGMQSDGRRLSGRLDSYELKLLEAVAHNSGVDKAVLDSMKPWLASEFLMVLAAEQAGLSPALSADEALKSRARRLGKNIRYFETVEEQIRLFADRDEAAQMALLIETMEGYNSLGAETIDTIKHWSVGETEKLSASIVTDFREKSPDYYAQLIADRNRTWAEELKTYLGGEGTGFAAVGIGHLLGEDGLPNMLREAGFSVARHYAFQGEDLIKPIELDISIADNPEN